MIDSIVFDRMLILSESQDQYQPNIPRLDVSSMRYASIVHDVVHSSQSLQDLDALVSGINRQREYSLSLA